MYKICSLFAGVGGIDLGFLETNKCEIAYANEFDKYAVETYEKNFNTKVDCRDIHDVKLNEIPDFDIMVGGFPCTSFSVAGYRKGFEDVAQSVLNMLKQRVAGDYLHTSAIIDRNGYVISAVNDVNDYHGPSTGYQISKERWEEIKNIPNAISPDSI